MARTAARAAARPTTPPPYLIDREFVYRGITYSPGGAVPDMPPEDLKHFLSTAHIVERGTTRLNRALILEPPTAHAYFRQGHLRVTDLIVLRRIRRWRPSPELLREILAEAEHQNRSEAIVEALKLALGIPFEG
jgi:hypothetical protein